MRKFLPYILLAAVVFIAYHQLLEMYFWRDDYTGLYIAQSGDLSKNPAYAYPYHWSLILDQFVYYLFGLNAVYHFLTMIILYIFNSWLLFYFLKKLLANSAIAFGGSLVFAAGFIGQDDMKMTQDGLNAMVALVFLLVSLIILLIYCNNRRKGLLLGSLVAFFLTLEISPHRASSSLVILLFLDWILSWKKRDLGLLLRNGLFVMVFFIQSILHPSVLLLGYQLRSAIGYSGLLSNFSPLYLLNLLGTFWNMVIPTPLQEQINTYLGLPSKQLTLFKFWLGGLPSIFFITIFTIYLKVLRPFVYTPIKLVKLLVMVFVVSFLWAMLIYQIEIDQTDLISVLNGGMWLIFLLSWIIFGIPKFKLLSVFSLLAIFGVLGTFFISIPERILVSYHRYLLLPSFTVSLLPIIFITSEIYQNNLQRKRLAQILFLMIILILVLPRLIFTYATQMDFKQDYSQHAQRIYRELRYFLPRIDRPTIIYIEGTTKKLQFAVGDAARVGYFGSEAAYAVNYQTKIENIILPQTLGEIPQLLKKNPQISYQDVYTFIYDEEGLKDTSTQVRKLLAGEVKPVVGSSDMWVKDTKSVKFTPSLKVWTLLPLRVKIPMRFFSKVEINELVVSWEYNTLGLVAEDKFVKITPIIDGLWYGYEFTIPGGGEYLEEISISLPEGVLMEVDKVQFSY